MFIRGRNKLKPVSKFMDEREREVPELDLDLEKKEKVGVSVRLDSSQAPLQPSLRRSQCLKEQCSSLPSSSCLLLSGSCPDTGPQHVPYSYSFPCPVLVNPAAVSPTRTNSMNGEDLQRSTGRTQKRTPLINLTPGSHCSIFNGQALPWEPLPSELSLLSADQSSYVASGRPKLGEEGARIRSVCLQPLAPSAPPQAVHHLPVGPQCLPPTQPLSLEPTGSKPCQDGLLFPHHTLLDPVAFGGSRFPSSCHFYTTGTSPDAVTPPAGERLSKCGPSQPSLSTGGRHLPADSRKSGMSSTSSLGETNPGLLAAVLPSGTSLLKEPLRLPRPNLQGVPGDKNIEPVSNLLTSNTDNYRMIPRESVSSFNECKSSVSGNIFNMKVRF